MCSAGFQTVFFIIIEVLFSGRVSDTLHICVPGVHTCVVCGCWHVFACFVLIARQVAWASNMPHVCVPNVLTCVVCENWLLIIIILFFVKV